LGPLWIHCWKLLRKFATPESILLAIAQLNLADNFFLQKGNKKYVKMVFFYL
jgi:hypothetical protein